MAEKTEKATPKKLRDARKKGQIAKSQDFPSAFTFVVSIGSTLFASGYIFQQLAAYIRSTFTLTSKTELLPLIANALVNSLYVILKTSLPIAIITALTGVIVNFLVIGPVFSGEAMVPDLKRLNPVTNIRNLFKMKTLIELLKSIFKIVGAVVIIYLVIWDSLPQIVGTAGIPVIGSAIVVSDFLFKVIVRIGIFFLIIAMIDLFFQKRFFGKEMMMEKFEVKQEYRDTEGDPHLKSRRKQIAQEIAYQEGPSAARRARAIITNPTHIAVALEYDEETEPAPKILTMGTGVIAEKIIEIGTRNHVPIMRNVELAQTLYEKGGIGEYVPEETYQAIAEILQWLKQMEEVEEIPEIFR